MPDSINQLELQLEKLPDSINHLYLAFSSGIDSCVLMHALLDYRIKYRITLWHINHGLQENADVMQEFASLLAQKYDIEFRLDFLELDQDAGNLEARARHKRYELFSQALLPSDALLTAHHMNDQAETLLLNLMRGSGPAGLRAIASKSTLGNGILFRPLLSTPRFKIEQYAKSHNLKWVEDMSNQDNCFDRNYLRHDILPLILNRWPATIQQLHRVSELQNEAEVLQTELAQSDLILAGNKHLFSSYLVLNIVTLRDLSSLRQRNLIRYWISNAGFTPVGYNKMHELIRQLSNSATSITLEGNGYQIKLFRSQLFVVEHLDLKLNEKYEVKGDQALEIPELEIETSRVSLLSYIKQQDIGQELSIQFRSKGNHGKPNRHSHSLKRLFQKFSVPPWLRDSCPQIFVDNDLVALLLPENHSEGS